MRGLLTTTGNLPFRVLKIIQRVLEGATSAAYVADQTTQDPDLYNRKHSWRTP
jgi:hypothetical protein